MSAQPQHFLGAASNDADPQETKEWLDALSAVIDREGAERAHFLIEEMLEKRAESKKEFRDVLLQEQKRNDEGEDVSLFVKNVENVQGDERDLIIFSTTFGPDAAGAVRALVCRRVEVGTE